MQRRKRHAEGDGREGEGSGERRRIMSRPIDYLVPHSTAICDANARKTRSELYDRHWIELEWESCGNTVESDVGKE